ncbi:glycosyl hydrolase family 18 protein [Thermococcus nautili]|uniref:Chitinase n=1 Tax=Thermococcus nautili TaxID=195522 RepID=W8NU61_9EURY|nr:glycosyl hydrolase family 18 protein [Thermococcus nautili]AHL22682.1 Chitinase [Thermococcus nautili]
MNRRQFLSMAVVAVMLFAVVPAVVPFFGLVSASQIQLSGSAVAWDVVNLTWTPVENAKAYEIYRSTDPTNVISPENLLVVVNWSSYPQYEPGKTYLQGDIVEYDGKIWRAKYWTQSAPGGDAWELIGDATPATEYLDQYHLKANTTYFYAVVPVLSDGSKGTPSGILQVTTPYEPYRVIVYYISWARYARKFYVSDIPWDKVTHVNYAFLDLKEDGTVTYYDTYADPLNLEEIKKYKEKYPAVKVLVSVGGWTLSKYFSPVAADPAKRQRFAESVLEIIRKYNLDGVDIDWEYPGGGGLESNYVSPDDGKNFVLLLKTIREVFDQAEKVDHKDYLITAAVPADPLKASRINWTEASKYLDSINVMTYDYHGAWENVTGHNAPLYADPNAPYTDPNVKWNFNVNASIQWYISHVPDKTKITLGLPFYGRSFANVPPTNNGLYQSFSGTPDGTWGPASETYGVMDYWDIADKIASGEYERHWDPIAMVPYAYSPTKKVFISYDDPESIGIKVDYALKNGIGGVMVWEITADRKPGTSDHPLLDTILEHLKEKPPAWIPDTYYIGSSVPANLTVPEPVYNETTPSTGNESPVNQTTPDNSTSEGSAPSDNQTVPDNSTSGDTGVPDNQTDTTPDNQTGTTPSNETGSTPGTPAENVTLYKPGTISVKHTNWGTGGEYDITLNLGGQYDWELYVKLEGATLASYWSADKSTNGTWIVFTPKSWNRGPTASFGFTYQGSVENITMVLVINGVVWDVWPEGPVPADFSSLSSVPSETTNGGTDNSNVAIAAKVSWPDRVFSPYVDITLWPTPSISEMMKKTGVRFFNLAFIIASSDGTCTPAWAGAYKVSDGFYVDEINKVRQMGGDVLIAFGGANGPYLAEKCSTPEELAQAIEEVIKTYNATWLTFDVEGSYLQDTAQNDRRAKALAIIQRKYPNVHIGFTLPVLPSGLTQPGIDLLKNAIQNGVRIDRVDIMAMDYGDWAAPNPDGKMGDYAIQAAQNTFKQLKELFPNKSDAEIWKMISITPMIGVNDVTSEVFYPSDAWKLLDWANETGVGMLSMWSMTRDHPGSGAVSPHHSSLPDIEDYEFSRIFNLYTDQSNLPPLSFTPELGPVPREDNQTEAVPVNETQSDGGASSNQTTTDNQTVQEEPQDTTPTNQTETTPSNQTAPDDSTSGGSETPADQTGDLVKPGAISVKVTDWGSTEYDVTLDLGGQYDWVVRVKLKDGSRITSIWSVNKAEENGWIVLTPVSWNKGPTASFGFIASGSKPVEQMVLEVNGQVWDVWPEGSSVPSENTENQTTSDNSTSESPSTPSENQTVPDNGTAYVPAGSGLPEHFFAPYIDMTLTDVHRPLVEYYNLTGTPYFTLAFVLYGSAQNGPSWGGKLPLDYYLNEVKELREAGGDVIIAFGGAVGPYLCQQAQNAEQLANWYLQVIDLYNATYLDFDIESSVNADLLADALLIVQRERNVSISFTLPSDPGAGLVGNGYSIIQTMVQKGVKIDRVNVMTMDYYWTPSNADNAIKVAEHLFSQLKSLYPSKSDEEIWGMIGLTPMIGVNDDHSVFTLSDAQKLVDWAVEHKIRALAFWSVDRDHPGPEGQVSPLHRGTSDPDWAYSHVFVQFMNAFVNDSSASAQAVAVPV